MQGYDLLVVGSANADLVTAVDRRPAAGETVLGSDLVTHPVARVPTRRSRPPGWGPVRGCSPGVGDDAHGRLLADSLAPAGVDTTGILAGGAPTGVALITVDLSGDNSIVVSPGANARPPRTTCAPPGRHWRLHASSP